MRIEAISPSPDRAGKYRISFEDGTVMRLYRQTVEDFQLYPGMELDAAQQRRLSSAAGEMSAKMRAVRIVSAANVSQRDLELRLIHKGEDPAQAKAAVQWMAELDLVDDSKTASQLVESCIRKGYGLAKAKQVLYEKRIPKQFWEDALADYPQQLDKIEEFLQSRLTGDSDEKQIRRAVDALLRRGHSYSQIRHVLRQMRFDTDELPED